VLFSLYEATGRKLTELLLRNGKSWHNGW